MDQSSERKVYIATYFPENRRSKVYTLWTAIRSCLEGENDYYFEIEGVAKDGKTAKVDVWGIPSKNWHPY